MVTLAAKSPLWPIQKTVYARLNADLSEGVYDDVPEGAAKPYVTIGVDTAERAGTKTNHSWEVDVEVVCWSEKRGKAEVKDLADRVVQSLTRAPDLDMSADGFTLVNPIMLISQSSFEVGVDGLERQEVLTFEAIVFEN